MAVQTSSAQDLTMSTNSSFQGIWGGVFDTFITANGWTYVSQTGDGNPNTAVPGSAGTYACFRVYSTAVSGETWYMRVDFGWVTNGPSIKLQFGSGNNGSGTLTGQTSTQQTFSPTSSIAGTGKFYAISAAAGRLFFTVAASSTNTQGSGFWFFSIHGGVNGSGTITTGLDQFADVGNSVWAVQNIPVTGTVPAALANLPCNQSITVSNVIGSHTMTFHPFTWNESGGNNPSPAVMLGGTTDFPSAGVAVTATLYGSTRTFLAMGQGSSVNTNLRVCPLYE